ncbi:MAG: thioredoxin domain-containing protein [Gammaproteobacteria bacterium]|nr:thioredoxin domain-containing protein [Gammaproteobacteria bacterium]
MAHKLIYIVIFLAMLSPARAELKNNVADHGSPYLSMHGTDPVKWQAWGQEALDLARKENKLLFMSVGYFSCYWCHVMQKDSFINADVATVLNKYFIPVIVDRELNPALDAHLVNFMEQYRGAAGWPMNVFITPEGYPLIGTLYSPQKEFLEVLVRLVDRWQIDSDKLKVIAKQAAKTQQITLSKNPEINKKLGKQFTNNYYQHALEIIDSTSGGFGDQSKFPMPSQLIALMDIFDADPGEELGEFLTLTLNQMATQGLRDHLEGGFFRYTVDPNWQIPHFEKMLYDNALLSSIYLRASIMFKNNEYERVAADTLNFMINHLSSPEGGMYSSFSAVDEEGIEGAYYVWTNDALKQILTPEEVKVIKFAWNMNGAYPIDEGYIPVNAYTDEEVSTYLKIDLQKTKKLLSQTKEKLRKARQKRHLPIDTKQLAAWNGLALTALSQGSQILNSDKYRDTARQLRDYIVSQLWDNKSLHRAKGNYGAMGNGKLEDYAYVAEGLLEYAKLTNKQQDYQLAKKIVQIGWKRFFNETGWHLTDNLLLPIESGEILLDDGALPSSSAKMISVSLQLASRFKDTALKKRALGALNNGHDLINGNPFAYASTISTLASYLNK